jgi:GR25 family glycosyltransferase involved in LPS biosynthesis
VPYHWSGCFINLDRSTDRRAALETALRRFGLGETYVRFAAVDGARSHTLGPLRPPVVGCFLSHYQALARSPRDGRYIHILEDDAALSAKMAPAIAGMMSAGHFDQFDLIFTDVILPPDLPLLKVLTKWFDKFAADSSLQLFDLKRVAFVGMSSYLVNPQSIAKVVGLLEAEFGRGPRVPVDIYVRSLVHAGTLKAACLFPFFTGVTGAATTINESTNGLDVVACGLRDAFFVDTDIDDLKRRLTGLIEATDRLPVDPRAEIIADLARFYLSSN